MIPITVLLHDRFEKPQVWKLKIPKMSREDAADTVFGICGMPPHIMPEWMSDILEKFPRTGLRSVSVGDTLIIGDATNPDVRHIATVMPGGFDFH